MSFSIIAAVAQNNVIGKDNKLPWDIPEDLEYFYNLVRGKIVVMGHKTYESIGGPIKDSKNIVLSHDHSLKLPGCVVLNSIQEVLDKYQDSEQEIMIIGGGGIYRDFLPFCNRMYLTFIHADVEGNIYFPRWNKKEWKEISRRDSSSNQYSYSFVVLERHKDA